STTGACNARSICDDQVESSVTETAIEGVSRANFTSKFIEAAGVRTHYIEAGSGPTLVLVHGGGAGADAFGNWGHLIPQLASDYRVVAVDMVGFGDTDKPEAASHLYTQAGRNEWLCDFLSKISSTPCIVVGNSMGGATTMGVAMRRPELISRMVL